MQSSQQCKVVQQLEQVDSDLTCRLLSLEQVNARLEESIRVMRSYLAEKRKASIPIVSPDIPPQSSQIQASTAKAETGVSSSGSAVVEEGESTEDKLSRILNLAKQTRTPSAKLKRDSDEVSVASSTAQSTSTTRSKYRTMSMASATARKPESLRSAFLKSASEGAGTRPPPSPDHVPSPIVQLKQANLPAPPTLLLEKEESIKLRSIKQQLALLRTRRPLLHGICHIIVSCHVARTSTAFSVVGGGSVLLRALIPHYEGSWGKIIARGSVRVDALQHEVAVSMRAITSVVESKHYRRTDQEAVQLVVLWYRVVLLQFLIAHAAQQPNVIVPQVNPVSATIFWSPLPFNVIYLIEKMKNTNNMETLLKIKQKWKQATRLRLATHFVSLQVQAVAAIEDIIAEICLPYVRLWLQQLRTSKRHSVSDDVWKNALMYLRCIANVLLHQGKKANCICFVQT